MRLLIALALVSVALVSLSVGCGSEPTVDPTATCGPDNCTGCCTDENQCVTGDTEASCGSGGQTCSVCIASQTCTAARTCELLFDAGVTDDAGTGTDAGVTEDGGVIEDGGVVTGDGGLAITAPAETWTWIDFPDAVCGNGSATGIGVNLTDKSNDVFIYMEGGGACWNELTCFTFPIASNLHTGYDGTRFANEPTRNAGPVNRAQATNPFKDMSYVYIPYCTGDVHAGDAVRKYGTRPDVHHKGAKNVEAFLTRLAPTFPNAAKIILSGSSAGAFGAQLNYERVAQAFPNAEVHVFADSGQMITPAQDRLGEWLAAWNFTVPAACTNCTTDFTLFPQYLATTYPNRRFALTAYTQDGTLRQFFGYSATDYETQTRALLTNRYDPYTNARYFLLAGSNHVMLGNFDTITAPDGTTLKEWTTRFVNGASNWGNVQ